ncbi:MAG: tetratricopeptide repeat protein [Janthinobacterium lividum]
MKLFRFLLLSFLIVCSALSVQAQQTAVNDAFLLDLYQNQRFAEAADFLKKTYLEPVTDLKTLAKLAYTTRMAGKLPEAESYYLRILAKDSMNVPVLMSLAGIQIKRENDGKALVYYEKAIKIDTNNFAVYKQLGRLYLGKIDTINSLKYLQKANTLQPQEADVAADLSLLLISMKKIEPAQLVLKQAIAADSTNLLLLRCLAKLNYTNDRFKEAIKTCEQIKLLGDNSAEVVNMVATSYYMLKFYDCAIENFSLLQQQSERTYYLTAMSYKALEKYKLAADYFDKTLGEAISPYTNAYYNEKGSVLEKVKSFPSAAEAYQKGLFFKEKGIIYYTLACLYDRDLKDQKNAIRYYKKYLLTKPTVKQQVYISFTESRLKELAK